MRSRAGQNLIQGNKGSKDFVLEKFLPYVMTQVSEKLSSALASMYQQEFGLSVAEWRVMANLHQHTKLLSKDIAVKASMDKVKVSRAVQSLSNKGWIKKTLSEKDSRATYVSLTASGRGLMKRMIPKVLSWESELLNSINKKEFAALLQTLEKLDEGLN